MDYKNIPYQQQFFDFPVDQQSNTSLSELKPSLKTDQFYQINQIKKKKSSFQQTVLKEFSSKNEKPSKPSNIKPQIQYKWKEPKVAKLF